MSFLNLPLNMIWFDFFSTKIFWFLQISSYGPIPRSISLFVPLNITFFPVERAIGIKNLNVLPLSRQSNSRMSFSFLFVSLFIIY